MSILLPTWSQKLKYYVSYQPFTTHTNFQFFFINNNKIFFKKEKFGGGPSFYKLSTQQFSCKW